MTRCAAPGQSRPASPVARLRGWIGGTAKVSSVTRRAQARSQRVGRSLLDGVDLIPDDQGPGGRVPHCWYLPFYRRAAIFGDAPVSGDGSAAA